MSANSITDWPRFLPLLLLLLFGITEFGRAWMIVNILTSAAREGCRLAVVTEPNVSAVTARVTAVCGSAGVTPTLVTVTGPDAGDPERRVTVTVETNFQFFWGEIPNLFGDGSTLIGSIPLRASSVMRHESV